MKSSGGHGLEITGSENNIRGRWVIDGGGSAGISLSSANDNIIGKRGDTFYVEGSLDGRSACFSLNNSSYNVLGGEYDLRNCSKSVDSEKRGAHLGVLADGKILNSTTSAIIITQSKGVTFDSSCSMSMVDCDVGLAMIESTVNLSGFWSLKFSAWTLHHPSQALSLVTQSNLLIDPSWNGVIFGGSYGTGI